MTNLGLLLSIVGKEVKIELPHSAIAPLFFTDGTFNVLFSYPENVLNWMDFLHITEINNPLYKIFCANELNPYKLMLEMDNFFRERDKISVSRERGDRLRISNPDGSTANCVEDFDKTTKISDNAVERIISFINLLSGLTAWKYKSSKWSWSNFELFVFTKGDFKKDSLTLTNRNFVSFLEKNPLSWAMTSSDNIEYTLETPSKLN